MDDVKSHLETPVNLPANRADAEYNSDAIVDLLNGLDVEYVFLLPGSSYRGLHDSLVNYGRNHKPQMMSAEARMQPSEGWLARS